MAKILLVDDEKKIVEILALFLAKMGFEIISLFGGEEAVEFLKSGKKADLMLLDMKMPKVTGLDVLKEKKSLNDTTPVIILTGSTGQEEAYEQLKEFGFSREDIIYKPVDLFFLLTEIKKKLDMMT